MTRKVKLSGHGKFWFLDKNGKGPLAKLSHCNRKGDLKMILPIPDSYAHVYGNGIIKWYGKEIGHVSDLEDVK